MDNANSVKVRTPNGALKRVSLGSLDEAGLRDLLHRLQGEKDLVDVLKMSEAASFIIGRHIGKVQTELGKRMRELRAANSERSKQESAVFERQFMFVAKRILPDALYQQCLAETKEAAKDNAKLQHANHCARCGDHINNLKLEAADFNNVEPKHEDG